MMRRSVGGGPVMGRSLLALARLTPGLLARARLFYQYAALLLAGRGGSVRHARARRLRLHLNTGWRDWWVGDPGEVNALWEVFIAQQYGDFLPRQAALIIDAGANVGTTTAWFRIRYPEARVIAIEPDPYAFERLQRNVGLDPMVKTLHAALSSSDGTAEFVPGGWTWIGRLADAPVRIGEAPSRHRGETIDVKSLSLPTLCRHVAQNASVDILKLDVEGSEWRILTGALDGISAIALELHEPTPDGRPADQVLSDVAAREGFAIRRANWPTIRWLIR